MMVAECDCECEIELFGEFCLSAEEVRTLILAYSGADVIREWRRVAPAIRGDRDESRVHIPPLYIAGVRQQGSAASGTSATVLGRGNTPARAVEDLLWRLLGPRLLADDGV